MPFGVAPASPLNKASRPSFAVPNTATATAVPRARCEMELQMGVLTTVSDCLPLGQEKQRLGQEPFL